MDHGEYWDRYNLPKKQRLKPHPVSKIDWTYSRLALTYRRTYHGEPCGTQSPTCPTPARRLLSKDTNHWLNPGARIYPGHTGSPLDEPAKVLKAGAHGVPGGEICFAYPSGEVRYFTVRECARLQTFPDDYVFMGSWTESMRQLGNAVPVLLAKVVAKGVHDRLYRFSNAAIHDNDIHCGTSFSHRWRESLRGGATKKPCPHANTRARR